MTTFTPFITSFRDRLQARATAREATTTSGNPGSALVSVEFEIYGNFEGAYFKKYCKEECSRLGLTGWVKTSSRGTMIGKLEGPKAKVDQMISWLSYHGSPGCQVAECRLYNYEHLRRPEFRSFTLRF